MAAHAGPSGSCQWGQSDSKGREFGPNSTPVPSPIEACEVVNLLQKMKMKVEKEGVAQRFK